MKTLAASSLPSLLAHGAPDPGARTELRRQVVRALAPLCAVLALVAVWVATAPMSGAVVAQAQVKVELNRKTVAHQEGGIVREILVRYGQKVRAGEPLIVVGNVRGDAELSLLQDQVRAERIRGLRAAAEAALEAGFRVPPELVDLPAADGHLARERALLAARRRTLDEHLASLRSQISEAHAQIAALESQLEETDTSARLSAEELEINAKLAHQGFVQRTRLLALQRNAADYRARVGEYRSDLAIARQRVGELEARIALARNQYRQQGADELKEATARTRELEERLRPSQDQVERMTVRAPVDGEVMAMRVSAVGEVIGPREPLLDVVPARERLVVEARIRPEDIDYVRRDGDAEVRLTAFDARTVPLLPGKVLFVSPDRVIASDGRDAWFVATIEVDVGAVGERSAIRLQAGMPAEVFVTTSARTLLEYLLQPLNAFANRAMREP
jgi:HlyD family type I secretion membrane fusion protein